LTVDMVGCCGAIWICQLLWKWWFSPM